MDVRSLSTDFVLDPHESDFFGHENQKVIVCSEGLGECKYQFFYILVKGSGILF